MNGTAEELLERPQPPLPQVLAPLAALALVVGVIWATADSRTIWYVIRSTGVIAYVLLAASVIVGLLISGRSVPAGRPRVDVYELHMFTSLLALAFGLTHALSLLFDNFVRFSTVQIFVPFTSSYRPFSVALGIIGLYLVAAVYASFWARQRIGYGRWRKFHYATFGAFALLTLHGLLSGADAHASWLIAIYTTACLAVAALTLSRIAATRMRVARAT